MGQFGMDATRQAGDWTNAGSVYKGNAGINSALSQSQNIINAANLANQYNLGAAGATAASQYGLGNVWGNFYEQAGNTIGGQVDKYNQQQQSPNSPQSRMAMQNYQNYYYPYVPMTF